MGAGLNGDFLFFDKLLTSTYLLLVQTCRPWLAIPGRRERVMYRWTGAGIPCSSNGKSLINSSTAWVKSYLMALFWETRSMRLVLREHPSLPTQNTTSAASSRWASLPKNQAMSGHAAEHLSKIAQAVAAYYLWCLVIEPHCWFSLRAPACIFITRAHLPPFHQASLASGCDRCSRNLSALTGILLKVFFFLYFNKIRAGTSGEMKGGEGSGGGVIATCHFIQLHFNLGCLEESRSANDFTGGVAALEGGRRDLSCWYLATNHLDMNYSLSNGNPYSSSSPKALLWGCRCVAAFISSPYPLPHPCTLIKTSTHFKALHHPLTHIEFPLLHHWVYGPSLGLLMTPHRLIHMNMEISHIVHTLPYITGLI